MKTHHIVLAIALSVCSLTANAASSIGKISSFSDLPKQVKKMGHPTSTLAVFDNDDTLTMMPCDLEKPVENCQFLGGAAWFSWQEALLKDESSPYRVAKDFGQLLKISELLFALSNSDYTEAAVAPALTTITEKGVRVIVETARGNSNIAATQSQFMQLDTASGKLNELFESSSLVFDQSGSNSLASPFVPCMLPSYREISYQQGIVYVAGQDKGVILKCLVDRYNQSAVAAGSGAKITNIIFMDDTLKNVKAVHQAFKNDDHYKVKALHYTALQKHKAQLTSGELAETLQKNANKRFTAIKTVLEQQLLSPNLGK